MSTLRSARVRSTRARTTASAVAFLALVLFVLVAPVAPSAGQSGPDSDGVNRSAGGSAGFLPIAEFERTRFPIRSRIASRLGVSSEVVDRLMQDPSFYAKDDGSGVFVEGPIDRAASLSPEVQQTGVAGRDPATLGAGPVPPDSFSLHSRPGSDKTLYLQFRDITSGPYWNNNATLSRSNFNFEDPPSSFSDAELSFIADTWSAVAEDFAPFDLDVTTEAPPPDRLIRSSPSDPIFGQAIAISTENFICPETCSGIAGLGEFGEYGAVTPGGWVFFEPFFRPAITALVISHEAGHLFGLSHDGTSSSEYYGGHGSWSPLMGSPAWYRTSQWSKGEYSGANNFEDDIGKIATTTGFIGDTVGDVVGTASVLGDGNVVVDGLVNSDADVDVYRIVHPGGRLRVDVTLNSISANLDPRLAVLSSAGATIATSDPPGAVSAVFDAALGAGTYYLAVSGEAYLTPSTGWSGYGSIGRYRLAVSRLFTPDVATSLTLMQANNDGLELSWVAPSDTGGGTTSYEAKVCRGADQLQCSAPVTAASLSATFPGLVRGQSYRGWVNVRNEALSSGFVSSDALIVGDVPGVPAASASLDAATEPALLTVSWCCVDTKGHSITGYEVERMDLATGWANRSTLNASPYSASDFVAGRVYAFRVRALAGSVAGNWSTWSFMSAPGRSDASAGQAGAIAFAFPRPIAGTASPLDSPTTVQRTSAPQA